MSRQGVGSSLIQLYVVFDRQWLVSEHAQSDSGNAITADIGAAHTVGSEKPMTLLCAVCGVNRLCVATGSSW